MNTNKLMAMGLGLACLTAASSGKTLVHDFTWMAGHWCQKHEGTVIEEQWLKPSGGLVVGMGRTVKNGEATGFEFQRIEYREGTPYYVAQPGGAPPVAFRLTAIGDGWARFENPSHDFPKRVEYRRTQGGLHAEIAGPGKDGKEKVIPFEYLRCAD
jgi:hypothetical protein